MFPETILLVDTYDTLDGVRQVVELAKELGPDCRLRGVRLDSGDLAELAKGTRSILDAAGLKVSKSLPAAGLMNTGSPTSSQQGPRSMPSGSEPA